MYPNNNSTSNYGHHGTTCNIVNGTQMIVMGGTFPHTDQCDAPLAYGQHTMNLGEIGPGKTLWERFGQNNPPYRLPKKLTQIIGGT